MRKQLVWVMLMTPLQAALAQALGAGQIENQLRQQHPLPAPARGNAVIEGAPAAAGASGASGASAPVPAAARVVVQHVRVEGNTVFGAATLEAVLGPYQGKTYTLDALNALARKIEQYYRSHGYMLTRVYLPPQTAADGEVLMKVLEGRYEKVQINNHSDVSTARIEKIIEANACDGVSGCHDQIVQEAPLRRALLLVGDLPGIAPQVQTNLAPGVSVGTTTLTVDPQAGKKVNAFVSMDNFSSPGVGDLEYLAGVTVNDVGVEGGQVTAAALTTGADLVSPVLAYSIPVGYLGTRVGVQYSYVHYSVMTAGLESYGIAQSYSAYVSHPLVRAVDHNLNLRFTLSHKLFDDTLLEGLGADHKNANTGTLALTGDDARLPGRGSLTYGASLTSGNIHGELLSADQLGVAGTYHKFNTSVALLQPVYGGVSAALGLQSQIASRNLDSSEMLLLGGPAGVRSAGTSSGFVTDGFLMNAELRYALRPVLGQRVTLYTFYDLGMGRTDKQPIPDSGRNSVALAGYGVGVSIGDARHYVARLTYARPTHSTEIGDTHSRFWLQLSYLL